MAGDQGTSNNSQTYLNQQTQLAALQSQYEDVMGDIDTLEDNIDNLETLINDTYTTTYWSNVKSQLAVIEARQADYDRRIGHLKDSLKDIFTNLVPGLEVADQRNEGLVDNLTSSSSFQTLRDQVDGLIEIVDAPSSVANGLLLDYENFQSTLSQLIDPTTGSVASL